MTARFVTVVATVRLSEDEGSDSLALEEQVRHALRVGGHTIVGCDWSPDGDTIVDHLDFEWGVDEHETLDLNPIRARAVTR
jgi:hypothetical protein